MTRMDFAKSVTCFELYGGDLNLAWQAEDAIEALTAVDVTDMAKRYFGCQAVGVLMPGDDTGTQDKSPAGG